MMRKEDSAALKAKAVQELLKEEKTLAQIASEDEVHPTQLKHWRAIALNGLPGLFERQENAVATRAAHAQQLSEFYAEIGTLTTQVNWLKKVTTLGREERLAFIERSSDELPLNIRADLLGVSRSSLYYQPRAPWAEEVRIKHRIDDIDTEVPYYGSRKSARQLQREGIGIKRKTVARYRQQMSIAAIYAGPHLSKRNQQEGVYPYLLRHVTSASPNHIWGRDITYIRLRGGWMYLVAMRDCYSRYVIS
jgi:putative transposase